MRMRQSLAQLERAFVEETQTDRDRRASLRRAAARRARHRQVQRMHRHASLRFGVLVLTLVGTAALVTFAMFKTLYYVMG